MYPNPFGQQKNIFVRISENSDKVLRKVLKVKLHITTFVFKLSRTHVQEKISVSFFLRFHDPYFYQCSYQLILPHEIPGNNNRIAT